MGPKLDNPGPDAALARLAADQHGVVTVAQLERIGIRRRGITRRLAAGRLHRVYRGVYAVGHTSLSHPGRWMAAVLAVGPNAVLSHLSAAALWRMLRPSGPIHVAVSTGSGRTGPRGIRLHRLVTLNERDVTRSLGIPVTTPSRTLHDLRRVLPPARVVAARREAEFLGLPLDSNTELDHTRSELEARFLRLCRRHRLPAPEVNVPVGPFLVDFLWRDRALVVEVDGFRAHGTRAAFEADRARDQRLKLLGYDVVRVTWRQLSEDPSSVAAMLRQLLRSR